jgi:hydroxymethylglutaryl-CoA lyase
VTVSASEAYNQRNVKMSTSDSEAEIAAIVQLAGAARQEQGVPIDAVISCAFGSPYEGEIEPSVVAELARRLLAAGVTSITYADTTGMATPRRIDEVLDANAGLRASLGAEHVGLHLHDTRGTALVNAYAALQRGITRFDTAVGGLGGSPFAHGAGGNLATEALVALLDDLGVETGIHVARLIDAALLVEELVGRPVPSGVAHHGPRQTLS